MDEAHGVEDEARRQALSNVIDAKTAEFAMLKQKARSSLISAYRDGSLEAIHASMETERRSLVKQKACRGLIDAKRSGQLEVLACEIAEKAEKLTALQVIFSGCARH